MRFWSEIIFLQKKHRTSYMAENLRNSIGGDTFWILILELLQIIKYWFILE